MPRAPVAPVIRTPSVRSLRTDTVVLLVLAPALGRVGSASVSSGPAGIRETPEIRYGDLMPQRFSRPRRPISPDRVILARPRRRSVIGVTLTEERPMAVYSIHDLPGPAD